MDFMGRRMQKLPATSESILRRWDSIKTGCYQGKCLRSKYETANRGGFAIPL
jgi:hypothetical protein